MKKILPLLILSLMFTLSCDDSYNNSASNRVLTATKPLNEIIGTYINTGYNSGTILIVDGAISVNKNISNYGALSFMLGLTAEQMQSTISNLAYNNVEAQVGLVRTTLPSVTLKITSELYDPSHGYTGTNLTYTQIECTVDYTTGKETFIVHDAECCSVNSTFKSLFGR